MMMMTTFDFRIVFSVELKWVPEMNISVLSSVYLITHVLIVLDDLYCFIFIAIKSTLE